jgi:hypothetical protein
VLIVKVIPPDWYSLGPDWFEYSLVEEKFVLFRGFREYILVRVILAVFMPGKSSVEVQP